MRHAAQILEMVTNVYPAHRDAVMINAQIKYLNGDLSAAALTLQKFLKTSKLKILQH